MDPQTCNRGSAVSSSTTASWWPDAEERPHLFREPCRYLVRQLANTLYADSFWDSAWHKQGFADAIKELRRIPSLPFRNKRVTSRVQWQIQMALNEAQQPPVLLTFGSSGWKTVSEAAAEHGWALARCTCPDNTPVTTADIEAAVVEVQERFRSAPIFAIAAGVDCMALAAYLAAHQGPAVQAAVLVGAPWSLPEALQREKALSRACPSSPETLTSWFSSTLPDPKAALGGVKTPLLLLHRPDDPLLGALPTAAAAANPLVPILLADPTRKSLASRTEDPGDAGGAPGGGCWVARRAMQWFNSFAELYYRPGSLACTSNGPAAAWAMSAAAPSPRRVRSRDSQPESAVCELPTIYEGAEPEEEPGSPTTPLLPEQTIALLRSWSRTLHVQAAAVSQPPAGAGGPEQGPAIGHGAPSQHLAQCSCTDASGPASVGDSGTGSAAVTQSQQPAGGMHREASLGSEEGSEEAQEAWSWVGIGPWAPRSLEKDLNDGGLDAAFWKAELFPNHFML